MKKCIVSLVVVTLLVAANGAVADLSAIGEPVEGNSWSQPFSESGVGSFNFVAVRMTSSGDAFESPAIHTFNRSGWTIGSEDATMANASGPAQTSMNFSIKFAGSTSNQLEFDFVSFNGDLLKDAAHAVWKPGSWAITTFTVSKSGVDGTGITGWQRSDFEAVPVPAAVLLGMLGLGAAGIRLRRFV